jgi:transposase-like protein
MLSVKRDARAAKRFFRKMLKTPSHSSTRVINVDKNRAYPQAVEQLKEEGTLPNRTQLRQCKYLNNLIEQDHRFMKRRVNPGLGFFSFNAAWRTIRGYEAMVRHEVESITVKRVKAMTSPCASPKLDSLVFSTTSLLIFPIAVFQI